MNDSRKDRVLCRFNRLIAPCVSGDSTFLFCFFSVRERAACILKILRSDWVRERQNFPISDHGHSNNTVTGIRGKS